MLAIKLKRVGKKHQPSFRVVVAEKRSKLGGEPVADLGSYNMRTKTLAVSKEKVEHWIKSGAQATVTVHNLFVKNSLISGKKFPVKMKKAKAAEAEKPAEAAAPAASQ